MAVLLPDDIIFKALDNGIKIIRDDFNSKSDEKDTYLYQIFADNKYQRYEFFEQAKQVLITKNTDPRHLRIFKFFNMERAAMPSIHITLPGEEKGETNIIGNLEDDYFAFGTDQYNEQYIRSFLPQYEVAITTDNPNEVVLLYQFVRALLISLEDHLELSGLQNIQFTGKDIHLRQANDLPRIFGRSIGMSFTYEVEVPRLFDSTSIDKIVFFPKMITSGSTTTVSISSSGVGVDTISNFIERNIEVVQESEIAFAIEEDSSDFNFNDYDGLLQAKDSDGNVVVELTSADSEIVYDGNIATIKFPSTKTNITVGDYDYDLQFTHKTSGKIYTPLFGVLTIKDQTTT